MIGRLYGTVLKKPASPGRISVFHGGQWSLSKLLAHTILQMKCSTVFTLSALQVILGFLRAKKIAKTLFQSFKFHTFPIVVDSWMCQDIHTVNPQKRPAGLILLLRLHLRVLSEFA